MISIKTNFILLMEKKKERTTSDSVLCFLVRNETKKNKTRIFTFSTKTNEKARKRNKLKFCDRNKRRNTFFHIEKNPINQIHRLNKERKKMIISNSTTTGAKIISM